MSRVLVGALIGTLLSTGAVAQTEPMPPTDPASSSGVSPLLVVAGIATVAIAADVLTGGALSAPLALAVRSAVRPVGGAPQAAAQSFVPHAVIVLGTLETGEAAAFGAAVPRQAAVAAEAPIAEAFNPWAPARPGAIETTPFDPWAPVGGRPAPVAP